MQNIKEISAKIQSLCISNFSNTEDLKEVFALLKEIENRKQETVDNIIGLADDYNKMVREISPKITETEEAPIEESISYASYSAKRDALRSCAKMLEEL